jgi:hypothetical protein
LDIDIHRFKAAADGIEFVPEAGPACIPQKSLPPTPMRFCARPAFKRLKVAPLLAHAKVGREERVNEIFVEKQTIGFGGNGILDLWSEAKKCFNAREHIHAHAEIDDY